MKKTTWSRVATLGFASIIFSAGCANLMEPSAKVTATGGANIGEATLESYNGPKARIAIAKFEIKAAKALGTIGDGMADMLGTALFQSNRYIVLERSSLSHVLAEQDLGASGRVRKETATKTGDIEGAELLVVGTVTEFEPGNAGMDAGASSSLWGTLGSFGGLPGMIVGSVFGAVAGSFQSSHVAIDLRIIDARTSRVVGATSVEGKATDIAGLGSLAGPVLGVGLSGYARTPMEKAIRIAIEAGVKFIVGKTPVNYFHFDESGKAMSNAPAVIPTVSPSLSPPLPPPPPPPINTPSAPSPAPPLNTPSITVDIITVYIKTQSANLRAEPGMTGKVIAVLKKGSQLTVLEKANDWYRVRTESSKVGYVGVSVTASRP